MSHPFSAGCVCSDCLRTAGLRYAINRYGSGGRIEPEPLPVEHTAQSVRGYRTWSVAYDRSGSLLPGLWPITGRSDTPWVSPFTKAECRSYLNRDEHEAPERSCQCGIYAWHRPDVSEILTGDCAGRLLGVVEGAGRVLWGGRGWRAAKARIVAVWASDAAVQEMIRATYPDARLYDDRAAMLADWPAHIETVPPSPEEMFKANLQASLNYITASMKATADAFAKGLAGLNIRVGQASGAFERLAAKANEIEDDAAPSDPRERALYLRQHRNTGPTGPRLDGRRSS